MQNVVTKPVLVPVKSVLHHKPYFTDYRVADQLVLLQRLILDGFIIDADFDSLFTGLPTVSPIIVIDATNNLDLSLVQHSD